MSNPTAETSFIGPELLHYLHRGFRANKTPKEQQDSILRKVDAHFLMDGILKNVESGLLEIVGTDEKGELSFKVSAAGAREFEAMGIKKGRKKP